MLIQLLYFYVIGIPTSYTPFNNFGMTAWLYFCMPLFRWLFLEMFTCTASSSTLLTTRKGLRGSWAANLAHECKLGS